eukprot:7785103-Pyramimonas_sp.AAC.1
MHRRCVGDAGAEKNWLRFALHRRCNNDAGRPFDSPSASNPRGDPRDLPPLARNHGALLAGVRERL